jgi:related to putative cytoplasmic structural protein
MAWTEKGREHEARMKKMDIEADQQKRAEELAAKEKADALHYENEERRRRADERRENQNRASQERIARTNAEKEILKARIEEKSLQKERDLKIALAQKQVDAVTKEQEEKTQRISISADRDVTIAKSHDEANVKMREQERLETQFIEREITRRGELTLEFMKEELNKLDRERERKHLEFEKLIETTRQQQKELQNAFERTGNLELISQISECETTLKQYISQDKKDEKQYGADKFLINEKMNRLFIDANSGEN